MTLDNNNLSPEGGLSPHFIIVLQIFTLVVYLQPVIFF